MKINKYLKFICTLLILPLFLTINVYGADRYDIPQSIKISTEKNKISVVDYENFEISSKRIHVEGRDEVVYCLEIDKGYPSGEIFNLNGAPDEDVDNIIAAGYPSKTPAELGVSTEDEAYFATQIAVWCSLEGYDIDKIKGSNSNIIAAIKQIYLQGAGASNIKTNLNKEYISANKSIQNVVVVFKIKPKMEG